MPIQTDSHAVLNSGKRIVLDRHQINSKEDSAKCGNAFSKSLGTGLDRDDFYTFSMESRPIPIEELQIGEFYDVQISDMPQIVCGALLLNQFSRSQATLLFINFSESCLKFTAHNYQFVLQKRSLLIETIHLDAVYAYRTFTSPPDKVMRWPGNYEGEDMISQISEEMRRAVKEGCWVFTLPHFCEGYLHIYFSYLSYKVNCPRRMERSDLWFEFIDFFFSALRDHILQSNPLSEAHLSPFAKALETMVRFSKWSSQIKAEKSVPSFRDKTRRLENLKMSVIDACRPHELSSIQFDSLWHCLIQEYPLELVARQLQGPLTLRKLLLDSTKLLGILSSREVSFQALSDAHFPGLLPEEIFRVRLRVVILNIKNFCMDGHNVSNKSIFKVAKHLLEDYQEFQLSLKELNRVILEEKFIDTVMHRGSPRLEEYVLTRTEMFPLVFAYLKGNPAHHLTFDSMLACVSARIASEDWTFITWACTNNFLLYECYSPSIHSIETYQKIKVIIETAVERKMSSDLLLSLLPIETFGYMVFTAFGDGFTLSHCKPTMLTYFGSEQRYINVVREITQSRNVPSKQLGKISASIYKVNLWYMLAGSVHMQLLWMRQFTSIKRLSVYLTRDICSYLA